MDVENKEVVGSNFARFILVFPRVKIKTMMRTFFFVHLKIKKISKTNKNL